MPSCGKHRTVLGLSSWASQKEHQYSRNFSGNRAALGLPRQAQEIDRFPRSRPQWCRLVLFNEDGITFHLEIFIATLENIAPEPMRSNAAPIEQPCTGKEKRPRTNRCDAPNVRSALLATTSRVWCLRSDSSVASNRDKRIDCSRIVRVFKGVAEGHSTGSIQVPLDSVHKTELSNGVFRSS